MSMKFSAADWCYFNKAKDPQTYYAQLCAAGYTGVEMVDPTRYAQARAAGLSILNLSGPGMQKGPNRRAHHAELLPQLRDAIAHAGAARIPQVIVFSGNRDGQPDAEGIAQCRHFYEQVLPDAAKHGVVLAFEMLNSVEHADYQAANGAYGFTLCQAFNSPSFRVLYDIYHLERMGEDAAAAVTSHLPQICHLHIAESPTRLAPKADGVIKYGRIIPKIVVAGYTGYWGMEFLPTGDVLTELRQARELFAKLAGK